MTNERLAELRRIAEAATPEQIANSLYPTTLSPATGQWHVRQPCMSEIAAALRSYGDARAEQARREERERCAKIAEQHAVDTGPFEVIRHSSATGNVQLVAAAIRKGANP